MTTTPAELASRYVPADVEPTIAARWTAARAFHAEPAAVDGGRGKEAGTPYCIVIPPPNVTAALHLGHALNNTLQDILIRCHRMRGFNTLWMPGTDHAGIATQTVVEKRVLAEEGKRRTDFARDQFVAKIQAWKDEYEQRITDQLKAMGCSCDWDRQRFTMDDTCAKAVREAFFKLFKDGLIYRGKRLVNWDPATQTALADDEVEMEEIDGHFYYLKYPVCDADGAPQVHAGLPTTLTVATTRPETMLGDTAVAVNPKDPRAPGLRGKYVRLPIVNRVIPIIEDDYVVLPDPDSDDAKAKFATGFLKVTPAHDPNDYDIGQRHKLPIINVFSPTATISKDHGWPAAEWSEPGRVGPGPCADAEFLLGLDRYEARKAVVEWFRQENLLEHVKPYRHSVGHSYRSHVPIEPYLSDQWYVKVTDDRLSGAALRSLDPSGTGVPPVSSSGTGVPPVSSSGTGVPPVSSSGTGVPPVSSSGTGVPPVSSSGTGVPPVSSSGTGVPPVSPSDAVHTLHRTRRNLPHWELGGSTYFVTFRTKQGQMSASERQVVSDAAWHWHNQRARIHLTVVMPDHVHLLLTPLQQPDGQWFALADLLHSIKSFSAHAINKLRGSQGRFWLDESFDRIIRDPEEFEQKWDYMRHNSVKAGLAPRPEDYPFLVQEEVSAAAADHRRDACATDACATDACATDACATDACATDACATDVSAADVSGTGVPPVSSSGTGALRFTPARYANTFRAWHENIRDWCISRQLWWGHRIPVWSKDGCLAAELAPRLSSDRTAIQEINDQTFVCLRKDDNQVIAFLESHGFTQDPDVLDTWFSSGLWPISTLGWPDDTPELRTWNPGNVLCTAREIITLWVSRMVMFNLYFRGTLPFTDVFIHAMIQDGEGRKMSKSLGNGVDPLDIIHSHGSDAMRFTLASMTTNTQDVRLPVERDPVSGRNTSLKFDQGRNFANKLWNAVRFALGKLGNAKSKADDPGPKPTAWADRWILSRLTATIRTIDDALGNYEFSVYASALYDFIWRDFCDWYIEAVKPTVESNPTQQRVLATCLDAILRLLHPVMPFVSEKLWEHLNAIAPQRGVDGLALPLSALLVTAAWPVCERAIDEEAQREFALVQRVVSALREMRTTYKVPPRQVVQVSAKAPAAIAQRILAQRELIETLANVCGREIGPHTVRPADAAAAIDGEIELYAHGLIDADAEKTRLTKRRDDLDKTIATLEGRLNNPSYAGKAPPHLVQQTRDQLTLARKERDGVADQLAAL